MALIGSFLGVRWYQQLQKSRIFRQDSSEVFAVPFVTEVNLKGFKNGVEMFLMLFLWIHLERLVNAMKMISRLISSKKHRKWLDVERDPGSSEFSFRSSEIHPLVSHFVGFVSDLCIYTLIIIRFHSNPIGSPLNHHTNTIETPFNHQWITNKFLMSRFFPINPFMETFLHVVQLPSCQVFVRCSYPRQLVPL